jgi:hypothetical protein
LPNQFTLLSFDFTFTLPKDISTARSPFTVDYFPLQILQLARELPKMEQFNATLTQGRWDASLMPRVNSFVTGDTDF